MMKAALLNVLIVSTILVFSGCGGGCPQEAANSADDLTWTPRFNNGDIVRLKMLGERQGIVKRCDYKYHPKLKAWSCIVDFYPSTALIHFDFSQFDNYERRYVYEFELAFVDRYSRYSNMGNIRRWMWLME